MFTSQKGTLFLQAAQALASSGPIDPFATERSLPTKKSLIWLREDSLSVGFVDKSMWQRPANLVLAVELAGRRRPLRSYQIKRSLIAG